MWPVSSLTNKIKQCYNGFVATPDYACDQKKKKKSTLMIQHIGCTTLIYFKQKVAREK